MKFSLSWLKTHLDTDADIHAVAKAMTMAGLEVEDIHDPAEALKPFSVAKVVSAARHPNADKLQVLQVETVDGPKEIVCGAPNARAGMGSIYAPIGAYVPGLGVTLVEKPVRGVVSNGMMCSAAELQLSAESDGILDLGDTWPVGTPAATVFGAEAVIDFEVTPNRPDWLGVDGIARDLAATGLGTLIRKPVAPIKGTFPCAITVAVDGQMCRHFTGRVVRGVKNGPSPQWLQDRLASIGLKSISTLVDITNFLSYDRDRPLHVYDVKKLSGTAINAGPAQAGSDFVALDSKTYALTSDMCAISDASGVIGAGGVMGGESTGVDFDTTDVFIEAAWFDPTTILQTVRATTITSDAGYRFARGVDPHFTKPGLDLATAMVLELCGGEASEITEAGAPLAGRNPVDFDPARVEAMTGMKLSTDRIAEILAALGFELSPLGDRFSVVVPSWRRDIGGSADLVEEVARIHGFSGIPATALPRLNAAPKGVLTGPQSRARIARRALASLGYHEAISWAFMRNDWAMAFGGGSAELVLANPIDSQLDTMRPTILANLLEAAGRNAARGLHGARLFEIGPVYDGDGPNQQRTAITAVCAPSKARHFSKDDQADLLALKSDMMHCLELMGAPMAALQWVQGQSTAHWHPGRSARIQMGPKNLIVEFGEIHPGLIKAMGLDGVYLGFEIRLEALPAVKVKASKARAPLRLSNLMPLKRDFAFVVPDTLKAGDLSRAIAGADKALIADVALFDLYQGKGVADGHISMAFEVTIQPVEKTRLEAEIETLSTAIIAAAQKFGAQLRTA